MKVSNEVIKKASELSLKALDIEKNSFEQT